MTYLEHTSFDKQKQSAKNKHLAFEVKSGDIKKVVIVRRRHYVKLYMHNNIPQILVYIIIL